MSQHTENKWSTLGAAGLHSPLGPRCLGYWLTSDGWMERTTVNPDIKRLQSFCADCFVCPQRSILLISALLCALRADHKGLHLPALLSVGIWLGFPSGRCWQKPEPREKEFRVFLACSLLAGPWPLAKATSLLHINPPYGSSHHKAPLQTRKKSFSLLLTSEGLGSFCVPLTLPTPVQVVPAKERTRLFPARSLIDNYFTSYSLAEKSMEVFIFFLPAPHFGAILMIKPNHFPDQCEWKP